METTENMDKQLGVLQGTLDMLSLKAVSLAAARLWRPPQYTANSPKTAWKSSKARFIRPLYRANIKA